MTERKYARDRRLTFSKIPKSLFVRQPSKLGLISPIARAFPYTQLKIGALLQMCDFVGEVVEKGVEGSIVEMGCGRGGCGALMAHVAESHDSHREVWLLDSFEGLSDPKEEDTKNAIKPLDKIQQGYLKVGQEVAEEAVRVMGIKHPERVHIVKGWFEESLPKVKNDMGSIAILRLDADLYEPTIYALEELYDRVVVGGYVVIDDYKNWVGCRRALYEFFYKKDVHPYLSQYPYDGKVYFKKEA